MNSECAAHLADNGNETTEIILWERYWTLKDEDSRNDLVDYYNEFVRAIAYMLYVKNRHTGVMLEDCVQYGFVGLLDAIPRYQKLQRAKFTTYASYRIKGEIYGGINRYFEYQSVLKYKRENELERLHSISHFHQKEEGDALERLIDITSDLAVSYYLETIEETVIEQMKDESGILDSMLGQLNFVALLDRLTDAQAKVMRGHYFYERSFTEIAEQMSLTKARISQLHAESVSQIRAIYLAERML